MIKLANKDYSTHRIIYNFRGMPITPHFRVKTILPKYLPSDTKIDYSTASLKKKVSRLKWLFLDENSSENLSVYSHIYK